jgi:hypothetical protein
VPLSTFDGQPTIHRHYDADGNLTGWTEIPGWSADDQAWALSLLAYEANRCPGCGGDLHETTDPEYLWRPEPPVVCLRCVGLEAAVKQHEKDPRHRAMLHHVAKVKKPQIGQRPRGR